MKRNLFKKSIAMIIIGTMIVSMLPTVFAAEDREIVPGQTIVLREEFDNWIGSGAGSGIFASGSVVSSLAEDVRPVYDNALRLYSRATTEAGTGTGEASDATTNYNNINWGNNAGPTAFQTTIPNTSTRTTISFEFMVPSTTNAKYTLKGQATTTGEFHFLRIEDDKIMLAKNAKDTDFNTEASYVAQTIAAHKWYKVDIIMDTTEERYDIYIDGKRALKDGKRAATSGDILKSLYWNVRLISGRTPAEDSLYIDNVVVGYDTAVMDVNFFGWNNTGIFGTTNNERSKLVKDDDSHYNEALSFFPKNATDGGDARASTTVSETAKYYTISYDFKLKSTDTSRYNIIGFTGANVQNHFCRIDNGMLYIPRNAVANDYNNDYQYCEKVKLERGKWYSLDIALNPEAGYYDLYLDDEHMARVAHATAPKAVITLFLMQIMPGATYVAGEQALYMDNFAIYDYSNGKPSIKDETITCDITSAFGNSYYDPSSIGFNISASGAAAAGSYNIEATIWDRTDNSYVGKVSDTVAATTGAFENYKLDIDMTSMAKQYGNFDLRIEVADTVNKHVYRYDTRYTVSNNEDFGFKNENMGFCNHFQYGQGGSILNIDDSIDLELHAGAGLVREEIHWADFETKDGEGESVYALTAKQGEWLVQAKARGIKPLIILGFDNSLYGDTFPPTTPEQLEAYGDYVYNVVDKTKAYTDSYEVWNEYNIQDYDGETVNPNFTAENYAKLLQVAYSRAKDANPDCKIYGFAAARDRFDEINKVRDDDYDYDALKWIKAVLDECAELKQTNPDIEGFMDAFSYHPYDLKGGTPENMGIDTEVATIKSLLASYTDDLGGAYADMEVIASEMGYDSGEDYASQLEQAKYTVRFAALSENCLDKLIWYVSGEKEVTDKKEQFGFFKNIDAEIPCEAKPVYSAITNYNTLIGNSTLYSEAEADNVYTYKFRNEFDGKVWMLWSTAADKTHTLNFNSYPYVNVYDMFGNKTTYTAGGEAPVLDISDAPIYIEYPKDFKIYVKNAQGRVTESLENIGENAFTLVVKGDKTLAKFEDALVIAGCYEEGMLKAAYTKNLAYSGDGQQTEIFETEIANDGFDEIKLFVWSGTAPSAPLIQSVEIK